MAGAVGGWWLGRLAIGGGAVGGYRWLLGAIGAVGGWGGWRLVAGAVGGYQWLLGAIGGWDGWRLVAGESVVGVVNGWCGRFGRRWCGRFGRTRSGVEPHERARASGRDWVHGSLIVAPNSSGNAIGAWVVACRCNEPSTLLR